MEGNRKPIKQNNNWIAERDYQIPELGGHPLSLTTSSIAAQLFPETRSSSKDKKVYCDPWGGGGGGGILCMEDTRTSEWRGFEAFSREWLRWCLVVQMGVKPIRIFWAWRKEVVEQDWRSRCDQRKCRESKLCESAGSKGCCGQIVSSCSHRFWRCRCSG